MVSQLTRKLFNAAWDLREDINATLRKRTTKYELRNARGKRPKLQKELGGSGDPGVISVKAQADEQAHLLKAKSKTGSTKWRLCARN